jgi:hypothetical protein
MGEELMKKAFYIFGEYLCNLSVICAIFMVAYALYLCYHTFIWWIALK